MFENYKSLDETSLSGLDDVFKAATGVVAPAMAPAIKLYGLQHDMMSSEARLRLCKYFQVQYMASPYESLRFFAFIVLAFF